MDGLNSLCKLITVVITLVALYGAWIANFGAGGAIGSMEGSVAIVALVLASMKCCKTMGCCGNSK